MDPEEYFALEQKDQQDITEAIDRTVAAGGLTEDGKPRTLGIFVVDEIGTNEHISGG